MNSIGHRREANACTDKEFTRFTVSLKVVFLALGFYKNCPQNKTAPIVKQGDGVEELRAGRPESLVEMAT
ncbi:hypothetical protein H6G17_26985 [Chroococcidiopsis sp. FACHB-1243]|uniref:hypothetical protein n=1 Tax=Chroococcidiopsis sp. [FACHB-1243] TaxID=2692781 RepID=UPI00177BE54A|nr:hypothetical protein [Chroococcidiopsis sp. [FACHB-1243]]MBD2309109.1 hypothetical protein [Chroococcidiopsis sp. [FACHB-1243]]